MQSSFFLKVLSSLAPVASLILVGVARAEERTRSFTPYVADMEVVDEAGGTRDLIRYYRDSHGRVRNDREDQIRIFSPPEAMTVFLYPETHVAQVFGYERDKLNSWWPLPKIVDQRSADPEVRVEELGVRTFEGLRLRGFRVRRLMSEGQLLVETETWVEPDADIIVEHTMKRFIVEGMQLMSNTSVNQYNIRLAEPDPSLFSIPENYELQSGTRPNPGEVPQRLP